jgi:hypothetical protein
MDSVSTGYYDRFLKGGYASRGVEFLSARVQDTRDTEGTVPKPRCVTPV